MCHHLWRGEREPGEQRKMLEIMSSSGSEAPESSPRQLLQVLLLADRTLHGLYVCLLLVRHFSLWIQLLLFQGTAQCFLFPPVSGSTQHRIIQDLYKTLPWVWYFPKAAGKSSPDLFLSESWAGRDLHLPPLTEMWPSTLQRGQLFTHTMFYCKAKGATWATSQN